MTGEFELLDLLDDELLTCDEEAEDWFVMLCEDDETLVFVALLICDEEAEDWFVILCEDDELLVLETLPPEEEPEGIGSTVQENTEISMMMNIAKKIHKM